jgi:hypothetical protein
LTNGKMLKRSRLQELLALGAAATGVPPEAMGSHSLRIGGATALYRAGHDIETLKRFGRWNSSAVHSYLWETNERQRGLAANMVKTTGMMVTGQKPSTPGDAPQKPRQRKVRFA